MAVAADEQAKFAAFTNRGDADDVSYEWQYRSLGSPEDAWETIPNATGRILKLDANTTGYGSTGPLASRGGFDMIAYATRTGLTTDVVPEGAHPYMPYQAQGDIPTGLYLSIGIMAAYINRLRTGLGDQVSCSLYGSGMMSAMVPILSGQKPYNNLWPKGRENVLPFSCMYRGSDDRWIMVAGLQWHKDWPRFVARLGLDPELVRRMMAPASIGSTPLKPAQVSVSSPCWTSCSLPRPCKSGATSSPRKTSPTTSA